MREVIELCISRLYNRFRQVHGRDPNTDEIYDLVRWAWRCNCNGNPMPSFAVAEAGSEIKGVFNVTRWFNCCEARNNDTLRPQLLLDYRQVDRDINDKRTAFVGESCGFADQYVGRRARRFYGGSYRFAESLQDVIQE